MSEILSTILEAQHIGYCLLNAQGTILEVGGALGWLPPEQRPVTGYTVQEVFPELIGYEAALNELLQGALPRLDLPYLNRPGMAGKPLYVTLSLSRHVQEERPLVLMIIVDASEAGTLEQLITQHRNELRLLNALQARQSIELQTLNRQLSRIAEIKSIFIAVAAHELRTPLTILQGYVELLGHHDDNLIPQQREYIAILQQAVTHLTHLVQVLLDTNRLETDRLDLHLQACDLETLIGDVVTSFSPQFQSRKQHLSLRLSPGLPKVLCDPTRIRQVFDNLLSNAHKYTPEGSEITVELDAPEPGLVRCQVKDNGPGIPPEEQELLFTPFFRGTQARARETQGIGLGLYLASNLVEMHGGALTCYSQPGEGTTFVFTLPALEESEN